MSQGGNVVAKQQELLWATKYIPIADILEYNDLSPRQGVDSDTVARYVTVFDELPPIDVFEISTDFERTDGVMVRSGDLILSDGFHRLHAALHLERVEIKSHVTRDTYQQAAEHALTINLKHGRPLNTKERRAVVEGLLRLHPERASKWLARDAGVDVKTVQAIRERLEARVEIPLLNTLITENGHTEPRQKPRVKPEPSPEPKPGPNNSLPADPQPQPPSSDTASFFNCLICGETFTESIWHCPGCGHHWTGETCLNNCDLSPSMCSYGECMVISESAVYHCLDCGGHTPVGYSDQKCQQCGSFNMGQVQEDEEVNEQNEQDDTITPASSWRLHISDIEHLTDFIEPNSIDFIVTDPPYGIDHLDVYEDLGYLAHNVLKDGGSLLVMVGQSYLPKVIEHLSSNLDYNWTFAYLTPGGQSPQIWQRKVNTFWKPVLWFTKGKYEGRWTGDVIKTPTNANDKRFHHWGQGEEGMHDLMQRLVSPSDIILDPFVGGGTTGIAALRLDCTFIGSDQDEIAIQTARSRLTIESEQQ